MQAARDRATDCVTLLLTRLGDGAGEQVGMVDNEGASAAHLACYFKHPTTLALLLDSGASMDARATYGRTPLMAATEEGATDCVTLLLALSGDAVGEQVGMVDNDGNMAAHLACYFDRPSALARLLDAGTSLDARNNRGLTPLIMAAGRGATACMKLLLARGGNALDLDAKQILNNTPLHLAARNGRHQDVSLLVHAGGDPTITNDFGQTPLQLARSQGHNQECVVLLEAAVTEPQRPRAFFKARALLDAAPQWQRRAAMRARGGNTALPWRQPLSTSSSGWGRVVSCRAWRWWRGNRARSWRHASSTRWGWRAGAWCCSRGRSPRWGWCRRCCWSCWR